MTEERGRSAEKESVGRKIRRSLSRSRSKSKADGDVKPAKKSKIKKMMKGFTRKKTSSSQSVSNMSTAISVVPDSVASSPPGSPAKAQRASTESSSAVTSLQLVMLLMDPQSRRFELLQLEFDSDKARVSDVIAQIPLSVTEPTLKALSFTGVIGSSGKVMTGDVRLVDFCKGKTVLAAVPEGVAAKDCIKLARPIICDKQVDKMLSGNGFDTTGWQKKSSSKSAPDAVEPKVLSLQETPKARASAGKKKGGMGNMLGLLVIFAIVIFSLDSFLKSPIKAGVPLKPGSWRSKCGILGLVPADLTASITGLLPADLTASITDCTNAFLEVHSDGTVSISGADSELAYLMAGAVCDEGDEDCVSGLILGEDGNVAIGGKKIKSAYKYGEGTSLSPWPFEESPKLKMKGSWMYGEKQ